MSRPVASPAPSVVHKITWFARSCLEQCVAPSEGYGAHRNSCGTLCIQDGDDRGSAKGVKAAKPDWLDAEKRPLQRATPGGLATLRRRRDICHSKCLSRTHRTICLLNYKAHQGISAAEGRALLVRSRDESGCLRHKMVCSWIRPCAPNNVKGRVPGVTHS